MRVEPFFLTAELSLFPPLLCRRCRVVAHPSQVNECERARVQREQGAALGVGHARVGERALATPPASSLTHTSE